MNSELGITNAIVFALVMQDEKFCKGMVERITGRKIKDIKIHNDGTIKKEQYRSDSEKVVQVVLNGRAVRLDAVFEGDEDWYNIEMQVEDLGDISKRSRYHHSISDVRRMQAERNRMKEDDETGTIPFNTLNKSFVIFICCFDYFNKGKSLYGFEMYDKKNRLSLNDESYTIIVNTTVTDNDLSKELKNLIEYVRENKVPEDDEWINDMNHRVGEIVRDEMGDELMYLKDEIAIQNAFYLEKGRKEGHKEGGNAAELKCIAILMKKQNIDIDTAMDILDISKENRDDIRKGISKLQIEKTV